MADQCISIEEQAFLSDRAFTEFGTLVREKTLVVGDLAITGRAAVITELATVADVAAYSLSYAASDSLTVVATAAIVRRVTALASEALQVSDAALGAIQGVVNESLTTADAARVYRHGVAGDTLHARDTALPSPRITATVREVLTIAERYVGQRVSHVQEALQVHGAISSFRRSMLLVEHLVVVDGTGSGGRVDALVTERARISDAYILSARTTVTVFESALVEDQAAPLGHGEAWTANTDTFAGSRYTDLPFNSIAAIGDVLYGAGEAGLYAMDARLDDGHPVQASIVTGQRTAGESVVRGGYLYSAMAADGPMQVRVLDVAGGRKGGHTYPFESRPADDVAPMRAKYGKGVRSRYWQFEVLNQDGTDFRISGGLAWVIDPGSRRV